MIKVLANDGLQQGAIDKLESLEIVHFIIIFFIQ